MRLSTAGSSRRGMVPYDGRRGRAPPASSGAAGGADGSAIVLRVFPHGGGPCRSAGDARSAGNAPRPAAGGGVEGHDAPLLQHGGEYRPDEKDIRVVAAAGGLDEDVAAVRGQVAGHAGHVQQEGAGGGLPQAAPVGGRREGRRRRTDADPHVRLAVRATAAVRAAVAVRTAGKGGERQGEGRAHVKPVCRVLVRRAAHAGFALVPAERREEPLRRPRRLVTLPRGGCPRTPRRGSGSGLPRRR